LRDVLKYHLPPIVWIIGCVVFAYVPDLLFRTNLPLGLGKFVHATVYFILCWLVRRAFSHQELVLQLKQRSLLGAFIFSAVYGLLDEFHNEFLPGHSAGALDLVAGVGGALLYVAIATVVGSGGHEGGGMSSEG
jgi:hypothetical protein